MKNLPNNFLRSGWTDPIPFGTLQKTEPGNGNAVSAGLIFLAAPWCAASKPCAFLLPKDRFIAVYNPYPTSEALLPELNMGCFSDAAFRCEDVSSVIHADCCTMKNKPVILNKLTCKVSVQTDEFCSVMTARAARHFCPDLRFRGFGDQLRRFTRQKRPAL